MVAPVLQVFCRAALRQRLSDLYADRTYVAMQRHGNFVPCVTGVNARKFFSFLVRYPPSCRSRRAASLAGRSDSNACWPQGQLPIFLASSHRAGQIPPTSKQRSRGA